MKGLHDRVISRNTESRAEIVSKAGAVLTSCCEVCLTFMAAAGDGDPDV